MFEVGLVLGVYLALVGAVVWQWMTQPAAVGYFLCGGLGLVNLALSLPSWEWLSRGEMSLAGAAMYIMSMLGQGIILILVGGRLYRDLTAHLRGTQTDLEGIHRPVDLSPAIKVIVLVAAGLGSVVVISLILSRRVFFLRPGEMWEFYVMLGGIAVLLGIGWLGLYLKKKEHT